MMSHPMEEMLRHYREAVAGEDALARFANLVTVDAEGVPVTRMVTIRQFDANEIRIMVNRQSPKCEHLEANGKYELTLFWPSLLIQYRLRGGFEIVRDEKTLAGWAQKPRSSQITDLTCGSRLRG